MREYKEAKRGHPPFMPYSTRNSSRDICRTLRDTQIRLPLPLRGFFVDVSYTERSPGVTGHLATNPPNHLATSEIATRKYSPFMFFWFKYLVALF